MDIDKNCAKYLHSQNHENPESSKRFERARDSFLQGEFQQMHVKHWTKQIIKENPIRIKALLFQNAQNKSSAYETFNYEYKYKIERHHP